MSFYVCSMLWGESLKSNFCLDVCSFGFIHLAMGQHPNRTPSEHPIQSLLKWTKMGGAPTPKWYHCVFTHSHLGKGGGYSSQVEHVQSNGNQH